MINYEKEFVELSRKAHEQQYNSIKESESILILGLGQEVFNLKNLEKKKIFVLDIQDNYKEMQDEFLMNNDFHIHIQDFNNLHKYPFSQRIDLVLCNFFLEYVKKIKHFFTIINDALHPKKGKLSLSLWNHDSSLVKTMNFIKKMESLSEQFNLEILSVLIYDQKRINTSLDKETKYKTMGIMQLEFRRKGK